MILIVLTAAINSGGTTQSFYYSDSRYITGTADTPANVAFEDRLVDSGNLGVSAFSDGTTGGESQLESGELILANDDGLLDILMTYSFDGRPVSIYSGTDATAAFPAGFTLAFTGTVESINADWQKIIIKLKDKQWKFDLPLLPNRYLGNNALPAGLEGTATDLKGKVKPRVYGQVFNVSPAFVNTSLLTYQVSDLAVTDISAVYDRGVSITKGADFATSALLQAASPGASTYITCFAEGYFRLGTTPAGQITADVLQGANAAARTVAQILKLIATVAGLSGGEISSADVTALDTANSNVVGIFLDNEDTFKTAMDLVAMSIGAYYGFDSTGVLRMGQLLAPSGTPVTTLYEYDVRDDISRRPPKDTGLPNWRVTVNHSKIYTMQASDLAGAVSTVRRAFLVDEYRSETTSDASVKTQWLLADQYTKDTLLTTSADAAAEAARLLAIYKVQRTVYDVAVDIDVFTSNSLKMLDLISLNINRFDLVGGKLCRIIGYRIELSTNTVRLTLWA